MRLIIGLGNPGKEYEDTRHNVGFMFIDLLSEKLASGLWSMNQKFKSLLYVANSSLLLGKPQTYMNDSGLAVSSLASFYKIPASDIFVVHDDLDIKLGDYKIQKGVGPKVHNGINSIEEKLGTKDFWRVRIGIENRNKVNKEAGDEYVLRRFGGEEKEILDRTNVKVVVNLSEETFNLIPLK